MTTIGIDASSLISGGARTHIQEILGQAEPRQWGIERVLLWGRHQLIQSLEPRPWLELRGSSLWLERGLAARTLWKNLVLPWEAWRSGCRLIYIPAGDGSQRFLPYVAMSRNILPFMPAELNRYGRFSKEWLKLTLLRHSQLRSFRNARGTIFLTEQARQIISRWDNRLSPSTVIPHGVSQAFRLPTRSHRTFHQFTPQAPARVLAIAPIEPAKHPWLLVEAVQKLRQRGISVVADIVGPRVHKPSLRRWEQALQVCDPEAVTHHGAVPHSQLPSFLASCDLFCFTSSCENFPNTLVEAMASGAPVVALGEPPMTAILGEAGGYFNRLDADSIAEALEHALRNPDWRSQVSGSAQQQAGQYDWKKCAQATFEYLAFCARGTPGTNS